MRQHIMTPKEKAYIAVILADLLYFGGFALVMALDLLPKGMFVDMAGLALLATFPLYLIFYGIFAYKMTKRILLPQVLFFLSLTVFLVFFTADNVDFSRTDAYDLMADGVAGALGIAIVSTAVCTGISLLTKAVGREMPPVSVPFLEQEEHMDK